MPGPSEDEILRPEARPLPFAELDKHQQAALVRVVGLLATASRAAQASAPDRETRPVQATPIGPYLEPARCSRNILLSGERGTGKTTLMLSLASVLSTGPGTPDDSLPQAVTDQAQALHRRLVWLETLDMEPLANGVNLLGAVLARIEDAVGARFPGLDKVPETVPLLYQDGSLHEVSREMARLQTSVALTFDGNLGDRAGSLDPDTFAVESRRAERERLGMDRRFASVLAGLSAALASNAQLTAPVFVLPVDDVDLNVSACVPLLRLLRATSSPHLIVVLAADVALLSTILRLKYLGELARISTTELSIDDQGMAGDLAVNALRKHLPPAQRVVLGLVEPKRALALRPLGPTTKSLSQVLGRVDLATDSARLLVSGAFGLTYDDMTNEQMVTTPCLPGPPVPDETEPDGPRQDEPADDPAQLAVRLEPFSWLQVLRQPLRRLVDLYLDCKVYAEEQRQHDPLAHDVTDTPLVQLARTRSQSWRDSAGTNDSQFQASGWLSPPSVLQPGPAPVIELPCHGWRIFVGSVPLDTIEAAVLAGCADLLGDRWTGVSPPAPYLAAVRATRSPPLTPGKENLIDWPWVSHSTFWAYERALAWLKQADQAWANQPDAAFGSWVAVMTAQLFDAPDHSQPFDQPTCPFAGDWTSLAKRLEPLDATPRGQAWLNAVGLLCTPEMGMTSYADILPSLLPSGRATQVQSLRAKRASNLPPALQELAQSWPPPTPEQSAPKETETAPARKSQPRRQSPGSEAPSAP